MPGGFRVLITRMVLVALASFSDSASGEEPAKSAAAPSKAGGAGSSGNVSAPGLNLPVASATEALPNGAYPVFITRTELLVGAPPRSVLLLPGAEQRSQYGVGAAYKASGLDGYVQPLGQALAERRCGAGGKVSPSTIIYADADVEYRVLMDVLYSMSQLGYSEVFLATRSPAAHAQPASTATRGVRVRAKKTASHTVELRPEGFTLRSQAGRTYGTDCSELNGPAGISGPWLTLAAVTNCANKLAGVTGNLHLVAPGATPVQRVLAALETLGRSRSVTPTFPKSDVPNVHDETIKPQPGRSSSETVSDAARVVAALRPAFQACYQEELKVAPSRAGKLRLTLRIGAQGNVNGVTVDAEGDLTSTITCVKAVAEGAKFAPPEGGGATIRVPVTFVKEPTALAGQKPPCTAAP